MATTFARRERLALCDDALAAGPDAPTLCEGWDVEDLVVHLLVRERRPWAAAGIFVKRLAPLTERAGAAYAGRPLGELVDRLRDPRPLPTALQLVERAMNTVEFFVHHEDIRRGRPGWSRRELAPEDERQLWRALRFLGRMAVRPAGVPVVVTDGATSLTLGRGERPVTVTGPVSELTLFLLGRRQVAGLSFDGPQEKVDRLQRATLGF